MLGYIVCLNRNSKGNVTHRVWKHRSRRKIHLDILKDIILIVNFLYRFLFGLQNHLSKLEHKFLLKILYLQKEVVLQDKLKHTISPTPTQHHNSAHTACPPLYPPVQTAPPHTQAHTLVRESLRRRGQGMQGCISTLRGS